jgi:hypothetical protein
MKNKNKQLVVKSASNIMLYFSPQRKYMGGVLGIGGTSFLCFDVWTYGLNNNNK